MEIKYELKPEDYYQFGGENPPPKPNDPTVILFQVMFFVFILADIIYALLFGNLADFKSVAIGFFVRVILVFCAFILSLTIYKLIFKRVANKVEKELEGGLFCEHWVILTEKEMIEITPNATARYSWKAIGEIKETESFLWIGNLMWNYFIIPKKFFKDADNVKKFVETANLYKQNAANVFQTSHFIEYEKRLEEQNSVE